jgi:hypothetical protein
MHLRGPVFFVLLRLAERGGFAVPIVFQPVPSLFLPGTQSLFIMLNLFPTFPISSHVLSVAPHFIPYALPKGLLL